MQQLLTIARNTFTESIRQPIFAVVMLAATLFLVLNPSLAAYTLEDDNKLLTDMGFSTLFLAGLALAAFTATSVLSAEIEHKTVLTVISKPVSRWLFVLGKFIGVSGALAVAYWTLSLVFLLSLRHRVMQTASDPIDWPVWTFGMIALVGALSWAVLGNYLYRRVFTSNFVVAAAILTTIGYFCVLMIGKGWMFQPIGTEFVVDESQLFQVIVGLVMIFEALLILCALAIACSTRFGQVMTLATCVVFFLFGLISDYLLGRFSGQNAFADVLYRVSPNMGFFWPADALSQGHDITAGYVALLTAYAIGYCGFLLGLAITLFESREVG